MMTNIFKITARSPIQKQVIVSQSYKTQGKPFVMATRAVGKITKAVALSSVLSQNVLQRVNCLSIQLPRPAATVLVQDISTTAGQRQKLWSCSKGVQGEITIHCLKDMLMDRNVQLFDVRQPHEISEMGKIPRSVNIPCKLVFCSATMGRILENLFLWKV